MPWGPLEALTCAFGRQLQYVNGYPTTRITSNFAPTATTLNVETTLGFPATGQIWVNDLLCTYTGITDNTFTGVSASSGESRYYTYGVRTEVSLHIPSVSPE